MRHSRGCSLLVLTLDLPDPASEHLLRVCTLAPHRFPPIPALSASVYLGSFSKAGAGWSRYKAVSPWTMK